MSGNTPQQQGPPAPASNRLVLKSGGSNDPAAAAPQQRYAEREDCIPCHLASGGMMTIAGLYSLIGARRGTDLLGQKVTSKGWLGFVGSCLTAGGLFFAAQPWLNPYLPAYMQSDRLSKKK